MCSSSLLHDAVKNLATDVVKRELSRDNNNQVIGLGSGSTVTVIVREMAKLPNKKTLEFVAASLQIKREAEKSGLKLVDENRIPDIDIVFDGADQIDSKFCMIKGGGGALLKEKILISAAKKVVILADSNKFVEAFSRSIPIEVHPFARSIVGIKLENTGGIPKLRTIEKDYPFITENGNIVLDTTFTSLADVQKKELELKGIAGVLEVGLFTRRADVYYKANSNGSFEIIKF
ncbi:MAG: ribose 5-phosphate isomerase A [Nitrososphaeraceae archaeon]